MLHRQQGIATLITLIALVIMLIAAVALVRSTNVSQVAAGNLAFRRDLTNRAEYATNKVDSLFGTGGTLNDATARQSNSASNNYSATTLATDAASGLPSVLLSSDATFSGTWTGADIDAGDGVTVRYIIDRLCNATGAPTASNCANGLTQFDTSGSAGETKAGGSFAPVYRVSIRVSGPKNTQAFVQTTFVQ